MVSILSAFILCFFRFLTESNLTHSGVSHYAYISLVVHVNKEASWTRRLLSMSSYNLTNSTTWYLICT